MRKYRNIIGKIGVLLFVGLLVSSLSLPAAADQGEYVGNFGGEEENEGQDAADEETLTVFSDGSSYDEVSGRYYQTVETCSFSTSIPNGCITTGSVSVNLAPALTAVLYRDGVQVQNGDLTEISAPGKYVLAVTENDDTKTVRVNFTIVSQLTSDIKEYELPVDFYMVSALRDGEAVDYDRSRVDLSRDGAYRIRYRAPSAGIDMELDVTIDHTAPVLTFTGLTDNKANGPVTITSEEEGVTVYIQRNGKQQVYSDTLEDTGVYTVTAKDEAGNENVYEFVIVTYMNSNVWALVIAIGVLVLAFIGYVIYYRKAIRVR